MVVTKFRENCSWIGGKPTVNFSSLLEATELDVIVFTTHDLSSIAKCSYGVGGFFLTSN
jgi:hypothetical protein